MEYYMPNSIVYFHGSLITHPSTLNSIFFELNMNIHMYMIVSTFIPFSFNATNLVPVYN